MSKILVPVDGSSAALAAVRHAIGAAQTRGATICLVNAQPLLNRHITQFLSARTVNEAREARGQAAMTEARALVESSGVRCRSVVLRGEPAAAIARYAADEKVGQIVLGERRRSALERWTIGALSNRLLARTATPVEIVSVTDSPKLARWAIPAAGLGLAAALLVAE